MRRHRDSRGQEQRLYRIAVGGANLALAAMLFYGVSRYFDVLVPRFGNRFFYVPLLMGGIALWMVVRGLTVLFGRGRGSS